MSYTENRKKPHFLIVQVIPKQQRIDTATTDLNETAQLITTFGGDVTAQMIQRLEHPDPNYYVGSGKIDELKSLTLEKKIDIVVINGQVKSSQLFRIERELWDISPQIQVWDRIDLILNIFDQHASTVEAKLQIKLARATHMGPRIYGLGKTELSRQGGGVGTRGKGETNIEFERRKIKFNQQKIKKELNKVLEQKHTRLQKRNEMGIGPVALVGYTSAGKTTLFNALTGKEKEMNKGLFTTLDTVVGKLKVSYFTQPILISDTIGFINNLPPVLINSFKSTLYESLEAQLLLHVIDASDPEVVLKIKVVKEILDTLGAVQPQILVLNKVDLISAEQLSTVVSQIESEFSQAGADVPSYYSLCTVSALSGAGLTELKEKISHFFK